MSEVKDSLESLIEGLEEAKAKSGQDITEEVRKVARQEGQPESLESLPGQPREALYEAVYQAEIKPSNNNVSNSLSAQSEMTQKEQEGVEDAVVDRFIRDFVNDLLRGV